MRSHHVISQFELEKLEQRTMLCGDWVDPAARGLPEIAAELPVSVAVSNNATADVIAAFAQGRGVRSGEVVWGETTIIGGAMVGTWAIVSRTNGKILAAGATLPLSLAENQPQEPGAGPAGAIASLEFPDIVQERTYFNHLEIQSNPHGHTTAPGNVNPNRNLEPHFDYHFYTVPEARVWQIPAQSPPLPPVPADRLPAGYTQAGASLPQMGRHSAPAWSLADPNPLSTIMLAGYLPDASRMHFLEPMISRQVLLQAQDFSLPVPMPQKFDFDALYPTRFEAVFHGDAHYFIFSDFIDTDPTTPVGAAGVALPCQVAPASPSRDLPTSSAPQSAMTLLTDGQKDGGNELPS